jgi:glycosyltransferase involved in cell wall biosynthesis
MDSRVFDVSVMYLRPENEVLQRLSNELIRDAAMCLSESSSLDFRALKKFALISKKMKFDAIVCTNMHPLIYAWFARLATKDRFKIIEVFHSTSLRGLFNKCKMFAFYPACRFADALIYVCNNQRRFWQRRLLSSKRSLVIYNGVDSGKFVDDFNIYEINRFRATYGFLPGEYVVGICAYLRPEKYHVDLLSAVSIAVKAGVKVRCLIIGDGPERNAIEREIRSLQIESDVRITGLLDDVRLALSAVDVLAVTSHHVETFSISALEAMSVCKPLIMTEIGGASEQVRHGWNGYLYKPGDVVTLAGHIQALEGKELRARMGKHSRQFVGENFSTVSMVEQYSAFFKSLVHASGGGNC